MQKVISNLKYWPDINLARKQRRETLQMALVHKTYRFILVPAAHLHHNIP